MSFSPNLLTRYSPAEVEVILHGYAAEQKILMKYTLFDLIIRKILAVDEEKKQASAREKVRDIKFIIKGPEYKGYVPLSHENVFTGFFSDDTENRIMLQHVVRMAYHDGPDDEFYFFNLIKNPEMRSVFHETWWNKLFGGVSYTVKGRELRRKMKLEIRETEKHFSEWLLARDIRATDIYNSINGNIVHLKNLAPGVPKISNNPFLAEFEVFANITFGRYNDPTDVFIFPY